MTKNQTTVNIKYLNIWITTEKLNTYQMWLIEKKQNNIFNLSFPNYIVFIGIELILCSNNLFWL